MRLVLGFIAFLQIGIVAAAPRMQETGEAAAKKLTDEAMSKLGSRIEARGIDGTRWLATSGEFPHSGTRAAQITETKKRGGVTRTRTWYSTEGLLEHVKVKTDRIGAKARIYTDERWLQSQTGATGLKKYLGKMQRTGKLRGK